MYTRIDSIFYWYFQIQQIFLLFAAPLADNNSPFATHAEHERMRKQGREGGKPQTMTGRIKFQIGTFSGIQPFHILSWIANSSHSFPCSIYCVGPRVCEWQAMEISNSLIHNNNIESLICTIVGRVSCRQITKHMNTVYLHLICSKTTYENQAVNQLNH